MKVSSTTLAVAVVGFFSPASSLPTASTAVFSNTTFSTGTAISGSSTVSTLTPSALSAIKYSNTTTNVRPLSSFVSTPVNNHKAPSSAATTLNPNSNPSLTSSILNSGSVNGVALAVAAGQGISSGQNSGLAQSGNNGAASNGKGSSGQGTNGSGAAPAATTVFVTVTAPAMCAATGPVGSAGSSGYGTSGNSSPGSSGSLSSSSRTGSGSSSSSGSGSDSGSGSGAMTNSSSTSSSYVAPSTLLPAVHWDHPVDSLDNLKPGDSHQLYYSDSGIADPAVQHLFASLSTTLQHAAVILDHSSFVKSVSCAADGILVTFTSQEAFSYAAAAWQAVHEFVLVTYTNGCGSADDQRTFWLINGITLQSDSNSILAKVSKEIAVEEALDAVDLVWGTYYPPGSNSSGTAFGSTSGGSTTGSLDSGNSTQTGSSTGNTSSNYGSSCGAAPSTTIDGFPAAACGAADFDKQLDDAIGYFDMTNPSDYGNDVKDFVPDVDFDSDDLLDDDADGNLTRRALRKRGFWSWVKKAVSTVVKVAVKVATAPLQIATAAIKQIPIVGKFIAKVTEFDPSISGTTDIKLGPSNSATSPWGDAAMIFQKASSSGKAQADVTLYCVDCGIKGHVTVAGVAKWNLLDGLKALNANMKANMEAGLNLGLVATAIFSDEKKKPLINQAIPNLGMSVKGIFSAGVFVGVDAVAKMNIKAEGQALVGVTMAWPAFEATMDLIGDGSKVTGYEPQFKKRFEASGTISADARLSLPISFNVGIEIIPISFKKAISLIEEPSLFGNITFAGSTPGEPPASETCNNGFEYFANAQNDIKLDLFGAKTIVLNHYDSPPLLQGCKLLDAAASATGSDNSQTGATAGQTTTGGSDTSSSGSTAGTAETSDGGKASDGSNETTDTQSSGDAASTSDQQTSDTTTKDSTASTSEQSSTTEKRFAKLSPRQNTTSSTSSSTSSTIIENDGEDDFGSNPSDSSADLDPSDPSLDNDAANAEAGASNATTNDGFTYAPILESHGAFALVPGADGNLYAGPASEGAANGSALFGTYDGAAAVDDGGRVLHYYPDVMAAYGASRIRLSDEAQIPRTADFVVLQPLDADGDGQSDVLFAVDTKGGAYGLVLCDFGNGAASRLFVVSGEDGVQKLMSENAKYTVTGAPVTGCDPVALVLGKTG